MAGKLYQYVAQLSRNVSYFCRDWLLFCKVLDLVLKPYLVVCHVVSIKFIVQFYLLVKL